MRTADTERLLAALREISRVPSNVLAEVVEVYLTADEIIELASNPVVLRIELIEPSYDRVVSQGRAAHNASAWIAGGYTGAGVKVGIIDNSFIGIRSLMGIELPSTVVSRCYVGIGFYTANIADCETRNDHGTAVAESLVDVAPGVTLYIANPISKIDFNNTVAWMVAQGVKVINLSAVWPWDGPGDGSSPASDSPLRGVNMAVFGGATFVTSAGNEGEATWLGTWNDSDGDGLHQFSGPAEDNGVYLLAGETVGLQLRWQDSWSAATTDLDLSLYDPAGTLVEESADGQSGRFGDTPFELLTYVAPAAGRYSFEVNRYAGAPPTWLQVQTLDSQPVEFSTAGSIGNPAETANPGALTVGAARWDTASILESFSSRGPTPDGRVKPDIVGADGADTVTFGAFSGTSQAAPHVAGLAALVAGAFPAYTPQQVAAYLKNSAQPRGPVPNNTWGYGFAWLSDLQPVVTPSAPTNLRVSASVGNTVTIEWTQPGETPSGYVVEGGIAPGDVLASVPTRSPATTLTFSAPTGAFYIRVHALSGSARSTASNEIRIFVNVPAPPSAPTGLVGVANGTSLALSWVNTTAGGAPTSIELNVTGAIATTLTLPVAETFNFVGVPAGTYAFSITAVNPTGRSSPSGPVTLTFPGSCTGIVGVPTDFTAAVTGRVISLSWNPPATSGPVTDYAVIVTGTFSGTFPTTVRTLNGTVAPGSYTLSVVARNACGSGPPTVSQTVVVP